MEPSARAIAMIEGFEISSAAEYVARVTWPGGGSGLTIGIGYDLGYATVDEIGADWGMLPTGIVVRLQSYAGRKGSVAFKLLSNARDIVIPYATAKSVFDVVDIPRTSAEVERVFENTDKLSGDSFGALDSLVFNRGDSMIDTAPGNRREMRQIRDAMAARTFDLIPGYFRSMKRLWVGAGLPGLLARRDAEADLFQAGLGVAVAAAQPAAGTETADDLMAAELRTLGT